jgi:PII-like signaling protein
MEEMMLAKRVSILTYEGDRSDGHLLQRKLLDMLNEVGVEVATVVPAVAGYTKQMGITTKYLVEAGGRLPVIVQFIASPAQTERLLPVIRATVGKRMLTITDVEMDSPFLAS